MKALKVIIISVIFVALIFIVYYAVSPYKSAKKLPLINSSEVKSVYGTGKYSNRNLLDENILELDNLVSWYNKAEEIKDDSGTTPDCGVIIYLKDGREIYIWELSTQWVTIGIRSGEKSYYQTNAKSEELVNLFQKMMSE